MPPRPLSAIVFAITGGGLALLFVSGQSSSGRQAPPGRDYKEARPRMFVSSFEIAPGADRSDAQQLAGLWRGNGIELVMVPRPLEPEGSTVGLWGTVPRGSWEGAMTLRQHADGSWNGRFTSASTLNRVPVVLRRAAAASVEVRFGDAAPMLLHNAGKAASPLLERIAIIGHRGMSLGQTALMNQLSAIGHSSDFGCSGIEIDITVPYDADGRPRPDAMRVSHPAEWRSELLGQDSTGLSRLGGAPAVEAALDYAGRAGLRFIYLDPKLRWVLRRDPSQARRALETLVSMSAAHLAVWPGVIAIGSETTGPGESADVLDGLRREVRWPERLAWAIELTRGTDPARVAAYLENTSGVRPDIVSVNLLGISGGGGGVLRWFVKTIDGSMERRLAASGSRFVFWTAWNEDQFEGAVQAVSRTAARSGAEAAIITPYPHRLAFYLATHTAAIR